MRKYPSIEQFNNVVKNMRVHSKKYGVPLKTIEFQGTVKLHGTNACVAFLGDDVEFQSRERVLSYVSDNAGFCAWGLQNLDALKEIFQKLKSSVAFNTKSAYLYGEWCCSNIQSGIALNQIPEKKFALFEIVLVDDDNEFTLIDLTRFDWITDLLPNVFCIDNVVPSIKLEVDFNEPHLVQNYLLEKTLEVEQECPVGKYFGVSGIGEGLVWKAKTDFGVLRFKTKGEKHSSSKVKTVRELTTAEIESKENAKEFVEYALSENRLKQGIDKLIEMGLDVDIKSTGAYLKWIGSDVLKECIDVLIESKIERKDVMPLVNEKARQWYMTYLMEGNE